MMTTIALLLVLQLLALVVLIVIGTRARREAIALHAVSAVAPDPVDAVAQVGRLVEVARSRQTAAKSFGETKTLRLCRFGVSKHEVHVHDADPPPAIYTYGTVTYEYVERAHGDAAVYLYEEVRA